MYFSFDVNAKSADLLPSADGLLGTLTDEVHLQDEGSRRSTSNYNYGGTKRVRGKTRSRLEFKPHITLTLYHQLTMTEQLCVYDNGRTK